MNTNGGIEHLSSRELEVLYHVAAGGTNSRIAKRLGVSTSTIKTHVVHLCGKLHAINRANLVHIAHQEGLFHICPHDTWTQVDTDVPLEAGKQWRCAQCNVVRQTGWVPPGRELVP